MFVMLPFYGSLKLKVYLFLRSFGQQDWWECRVDFLLYCFLKRDGFKLLLDAKIVGRKAGGENVNN